MKIKIFALLMIALSLSGIKAQDLQILQTDGTLITVPLNAIDSITFFNFICGTSTINDADSNIYNTVLIGNHCWMKENLKTTKYRNGSSIDYPGSDNNAWQNNTTGAYAWFGNDSINKDIYGALYNGYAVSNANGLCPAGWHVPSDSEWKVLEGTVDTWYGVGNPEWDDEGWRGYDAGIHLKSTNGWVGGGNGTDWSGFKALPGGWRNNSGTFQELEKQGCWWSSSPCGGSSVWARSLRFDNDAVARSCALLKKGYSLRCLKN